MKQLCRDCRYAQIYTFPIHGENIETCCCSLTRQCTHADRDTCEYCNADLSSYEICYNCEYYLGGGDWGLSCSHKDGFYLICKFNDNACKHFKRKQVEK